MPKNQHYSGLYDPQDYRDACGFGLIAQIQGRPSHATVATAIESVCNMAHRGAVNRDGKTGDGCGLLMQKPDKFLRTQAQELFSASLDQSYAVGTVFFSRDQAKMAHARTQLETEVERNGLRIVGWRPLPTNPKVLGERAKSTMPHMEQLFINAGRLPLRQFQARLFLARRRAEIALADDPGFYISSLSPRLLSYKGLMMPNMLTTFYPDLKDPELQTSICVYHQRFATNTLPLWKLAQPYRMLAHNGEINTIRGNRNWAVARASKFRSKLLPELEQLMPLVSQDGSDSASVDNMVELLQTGGMNLMHALRMMVPPAWQNQARMDMELRAFYEYNSMIMEPWDGPAALVLTDGRNASCLLDRNGLRPARYVLDRKGFLTIASEIGVYDYRPQDIEEKGRLGPGDILAVDTRTGRIRHTKQIDTSLAGRNPYRQWLRERAVRLTSGEEDQATPARAIDDISPRLQKLFQFSLEEAEQVLRPLAEGGQEGTGAMGDDTPIAVLSGKARPLYDYFRQEFAQVTNPPIDSLREAMVMSLECCIGPQHNIFDLYAEHAHKAVLQSPVLSPWKYEMLLKSDFPSCTLDLTFDPTEGLEKGLRNLCEKAQNAVRDGYDVLVLREHLPTDGMLAIHALLATGAVHQALVRDGLRCDASIIVETASARDSHQVACLIGFGATAIYPWLAHSLLQQKAEHGTLSEDYSSAAVKYRKGLNKGLLKIFSKMGISTVASYRAAQLFAITGLHQEVIDLCFTGANNPIGGATFADLQGDIERVSAHSLDPSLPIETGGILKHVEGSEQHAFTPDVVMNLQRAVASGDKADWDRYAEDINNRPPLALRDLLQIRQGNGDPVPLDKVEAAESICTRMDSAGMSLGALSPEAHQDLARAMNSLGARSNSGEGGEDPARFGSETNSRIKQIASGRFGVTPHYLVNADVLQIKIAQGAKPGEGGQLPGRKVNSLIARLRHSVPGVTLISPPPHHDIYSIEDLKQLIYDLKQVNPQVAVSVKLVSSPGIGTIACGVCKAGADMITISGHDGGTAASPLTSIRYAGNPWELGLSETQQALITNGLRGRVRIQADGGLKTGLDVIKAAILGADSFGFGTAPMIALGCKYLRICHLNNCATGVATQNHRLRMEHYRGTYEKVRYFFLLLAEEIREHLAALGVNSLQEIIGRTELLEALPGVTGKQHNLDLSPLLYSPPSEYDELHFIAPAPPDEESDLTRRILADFMPLLDQEAPSGSRYYPISNRNRTIGARLAGEIARRRGNSGLEGSTLRMHFNGCAGQSFGAFSTGGMEMYLEGECNDYVGKGMAGGLIVLRPARSSNLATETTPIAGNTCLYGATGGRLYAAGIVGERFAVRNSGATAIVEGAGEHCCEYMTGGQVVVLGPTGQNFAAGMTGGFAYVLDKDSGFVDQCNRDMVALYRITGEDMETHRSNLRVHIETHVRLTHSEWGTHLLEDFDFHVRNFWLITAKAASIEKLLTSERYQAA